MARNPHSLLIVATLFLLQSCGLVGATEQPTPVIVTTTPVYATVVQFVTVPVPITVLVIVPTPVPPVSTVWPQDTITPAPLLPTQTPIPPAPTVIASDGLDDPAQGLVALSQVAQQLQSQGIHTIRVTVKLTVPIEITATGNPDMTSNIRDQLDIYQVHGDYILDISTDALAQGSWVIDALGGFNGLGLESVVELRQNGNDLWEKPVPGNWTTVALRPDQAQLPLGNLHTTIDSYGDTLNMSDLVVDALRPLLLVNGIQSGWNEVADDASGTDWIVVLRQREPASVDNFKAITAGLVNSLLSQYVDPSAVTTEVRQVVAVEKVWLDPATRLPDHSRVEIRGWGLVDVNYLLQQQALDAQMIQRSEITFEFLSTPTNVTAPAP